MQDLARLAWGEVGQAGLGWAGLHPIKFKKENFAQKLSFELN
jgi:hypothetical protein